MPPDAVRPMDSGEAPLSAPASETEPIAGPPPGYFGLERFLPSVTARARAFEVPRVTIAAWDHGGGAHVRDDDEHARRLWELCEAVDEYMELPEHTGLWVLTPQAFLFGRRPARFLMDGGDMQFLKMCLGPPSPTLTAEGDAQVAAFLEAMQG